MKNERKDRAAEYLLIILVLAGLSFLCFFPTFLNGKSFIWYNDQQFQFNIFYREWYRIVRDCVEQRIPAVYSWNDFLGTDFFVTKLMYCVGDFIALPYFVLHKGGIDVDRFLAFETLLCLVLSGITMRLYLAEFGIQKKEVRVSVSLLYALSGFAGIFCGSYMFMRFYALLPLLFYFCERYIRKGKLIGFALITAVLFLQNYELMFSTSLFLVLYFLFSEYLQGRKKLGERLKDALPLIGSYLCGIALCGFALLPLILYLRSNTRVGEMNSNGLFWNPNSLLAWLYGHFLPPFNYRSDRPPYPFYTDLHFGNEFSSFLCACLPLLYWRIFREGTAEEKKAFLWGRLILSVFLLFKPLNMIVHGLSEPTFRWSFLLIFFDAVVLAYVWERYEERKMHREITVLLVFFAVLSVLISLLRKSFGYLPYFALALLCIAALFVMQGKKKYVLSVLISAVFFAAGLLPPYYAYGQEEVGLNEEYLAYYREQDDSRFYRLHIPPEDIDPFSTLNLNTGLRYRYASVSTYSSTYETVLTPFVTANGIENWLIDLNDPEVLAMLGCKYYGVFDEKELPAGDFSYAYDLDDIHVYRLNDANEFAHTYNHFVITDSLPEDPDWNGTLYVSEKDAGLLEGIAPAEKAQLQVTEYNGQYLQGTVSVPGKTVLLVTVPYSSGWNVIDENGERLTTLNVQGGFLGVILEGGDHTLSFYYGTPGLKPGLLVSAAGFCALALLAFCTHKRKKNSELC
ncbi:MAG: YfhO family protein [Erysipelotrichaceae bacterium]|nr:YfhO family protein [Erysipelotrichaceae bacterium]